MADTWNIDENYDDAILREARKKQAQEKVEENKDAYQSSPLTFGDRTGQMPKAEYENSTSINYSAKQQYTSNYLDFGGTVAGVDVSEYTKGISSQYPLNQVIETLSGHVIEYNDTPENPRMLIKHAEGSGIDFRPDGTIVVSSFGEGKVEVNSGGHKLVVSGDGQLHYSGNLTMNVGGDFNVNVGGSYNVQAKSETKTIKGNSRDLYFGNKYTSIVGSRQDFATENYTSAALGFRDIYTKGNHKTASEGGSSINSKGVLSVSSEARITQASPDINIAADSLSVFGASGTIGGEGIIMYNYNMHTEETVHANDISANKMTASTFHGDLNGTAKQALDANRAATATEGATSPGGYTSTNTAATIDNYSPAKPTYALLRQYLHKGAYGIQKIFIDKGDHLKGAYDKSKATGSVTNRILTTSETRARMRDEGHRNNGKFANNQAQSGTINTEHANPVPSGGVAMTVDPKTATTSTRGTSANAPSPTARLQTNPNLQAKVKPDARFDANNKEAITPATEVAKGISLSQFIYGKGDGSKLDPTLSLPEKKQIYRNLGEHAKLVNRIRNNKDVFQNFNIEIIEGIYVKEPAESITPDGILDLRTKGRAVVYEITGPNGIIDKDKTFDTAIWLSKQTKYDKIILDYDELDPIGRNEDMNVQIIVIMPNIEEDYAASFKMETETLFNNVSQGKEFMKLGDTVNPIQDPADEATDDKPEEGEDEEQVGDDAGQIDGDKKDETPDTQVSGQPEDLTDEFDTKEEMEEHLKDTVGGDPSANGKSVVYDGEQQFIATSEGKDDKTGKDNFALSDTQKRAKAKYDTFKHTDSTEGLNTKAAEHKTKIIKAFGKEYYYTDIADNRAKLDSRNVPPPAGVNSWAEATEQQVTNFRFKK